MNLNEEVVNEILMNSNIHDIINLCSTSNQFNNICQDKHFWVNKFKKDNLILIQTHNWIDSYITAMVNKFIDYIKNQPYLTQNVTFKIPLDKLLEIDPKTFAFVKDDLFTTKTEEKITLSYNRVNDLWFVMIKGSLPKIIDDHLVISYLKNMIYMNINIKYNNGHEKYII